MGSTVGQSVTLANSIIGVGILAMPFCFQQCGIILATLLLLLAGLVSRLCCHYLLKSALLSRRRNFEYLALYVFGPTGKLAIEIGIIGFLMGTCIAYFVVVGDLGPQIISKMFNINQSDVLRTCIMVIVSLVCVLPLGLLRNVDSLSNVSAATICFYFCLVIKVIAEAASQLFTADWYTKVAMWRPEGMMQCIPILSMALFCQTQLFEIFESMPSLSLEKMNVVTKNAINICSAVYLTLGLFGYIAFGSHNISGNILMSLSPSMANDAIRLGFVMSLAFSFPLIIFPCRASLYSLLYKKGYPAHHDHLINHSIPEASFRIITISIIAVSLFISLLIPNIELVLGLVGSTIGVLVCVVFPAACFINITFKNTNERVLAKVVLVIGLLVLVLGTFANLQAAENQAVKYDDKHITQERIDKLVEDFFEAKRREHGEDSLIKPVNEIPEQIKEIKEISNGDNKPEIIPDSAAQPPNPVPPDSQAIKDNNNESNKANEAVKKEIASNVKDKIVEVNLAPKVESEQKEVDPPKSKENHVENEIPKTNVVVGSELKAEESKKNEKQDQILKVKQQELIETMQQQRVEQMELIKEQKEIIHELEQKQVDEVKNDDPKKVALESIQKIRDVALKKLNEADISAKETSDKKVASAVNIESAAVQEIAKQAVESIIAINEIQEKAMNAVINKNNDAENLSVPGEKSQLYGQNIAQSEALNIIAKDTNPETNKNYPNAISKHLHSPDEPNSYKQGEYIQQLNIKAPKETALPIALSLSENTHLKVALNNDEKNFKQNKETQAVNANEHKIDTLVREKRELLDCNEPYPANRDICKAELSENPNEVLLKNVDLNDALTRNVMDTAVVGRSLKSFAEVED